MFQKIKNSWNLAKECWRVLTLDKEMLMFPVLCLLVTGCVLATLGYGLDESGLRTWSEQPGEQTLVIFAVISAVMAFICYLIMAFFNTGLTACALIRLSGEDPVLADGFHVALRRLPQILGWAAISATIGLLLRVIKGRNNIFTDILSNVLGFAWNIGTFFTLPIIVAEEKGAIDAIKRSGQLTKSNWGETMTLNIGFGLLGGLLMIPIAGVTLFVLMSVGFSSPTTTFVVFCLAIVAAMVVMLVLLTLDAIAKSALYIYALGDELPVGFSKDLLNGTFKRTHNSGVATA